MQLSGALRQTLNSGVAEQDESGQDSASICAAVLALIGWALHVFNIRDQHVYNYFTHFVLYSKW